MTWRYLAQRLSDGAWLSRDLPLSDVAITYPLSGGTGITATITPEIGRAKADGRPLLDEWSSVLYAEEEGLIRAGSIVTAADFTGPQWQIGCTGFAAYPAGIAYTGATYSRTNADPLDVFRDLWDYLQTRQGGDLGLVVDGTKSTARVGNVKDSSGTVQPYVLNWWDSKDLGSEINQLATGTPFDYWEEHSWADAAHTQVSHRLRLGFPRAGRRQTGLRFTEGENIAAVVPVQRHGGEFANEIVALGAGEGSKTLRSQPAVRDGRVRRVVTITDQSITSQQQLDQIAQAELNSRQQLVEVTSCTVREHPNAPLGSFTVGDDVLIQVRYGWAAGTQVWSRITSYTITPADLGSVALTLVRSDRFRYVGGLQGSTTVGT